MKIRSKIAAELEVTCSDPKQPIPWNRVLVKVTHNSDRKRYDIDVRAVQRDGGFTNTLLLHGASSGYSGYVVAETAPRFSQERMDQLAAEALDRDDVIRMIARVCQCCALTLADKHKDVYEKIMDLIPR